MVPDPSALPQWLVVGLVVGAVGSVAVAVLFLLADRLFPTRTPGGPAYRTESRRRAEIRAYLEAIDEPYVADAEVDGQPVAFYLPERDVAITFDARAYYRLERSDATPVLVEHEMPGRQLGARLPFETPTVEFGPPEATTGTRSSGQAFRELGVSPSAPLEEVRDAYRRRVKEVHPDHGGDEEDFRRVREAYATARRRAGEPGP